MLTFDQLIHQPDYVKALRQSQKHTHAEVGYQARPHGDEQCDRCHKYRAAIAPGDQSMHSWAIEALAFDHVAEPACIKVQSPISPTGWCQRFERQATPGVEAFETNKAFDSSEARDNHGKQMRLFDDVISKWNPSEPRDRKGKWRNRHRRARKASKAFDPNQPRNKDGEWTLDVSGSAKNTDAAGREREAGQTEFTLAIGSLWNHLQSAGHKLLQDNVDSHQQSVNEKQKAVTDLRTQLAQTKWGEDSHTDIHDKLAFANQDLKNAQEDLRNSQQRRDAPLGTALRTMLSTATNFDFGKAFNPDELRDSHGMWTTGSDAPAPDYINGHEGEQIYDKNDDAQTRLSDHLYEVSKVNDKLYEASTKHQDINDEEPDREEVGDKAFDAWQAKDNKAGAKVADAAMALRDSLIEHANKTAEEIAKLDEALHQHEEDYGRRMGKGFNPDEERNTHGEWTSGGGDAAVADHLGRLKDAGLNDDKKFERALNRLANDNGIKNKELKQIVERYDSGHVVTGKTRDQLLDEITRAWVRRSRVGKNLTAGDVHAPTALGNEDPPKQKARDFLTTIAEVKGGARIVALTTLQDATKGFDPNEPRDERGRWTIAGASIDPSTSASDRAAINSAEKYLQPGQLSGMRIHVGDIGRHGGRQQGDDVTLHPDMLTNHPVWIAGTLVHEQAHRDQDQNAPHHLREAQAYLQESRWADDLRSKLTDETDKKVLLDFERDGLKWGEKEANAADRMRKGDDQDEAGTKTIYVVRHGSTDMNDHADDSKDRIRAWIDVPLNKHGIKDAEKAAKKAAKAGIEVLVSSDLKRASKTAEIIGKEVGVTPVMTPKLRPWDLGKFAGMPSKEAYPEVMPYVVDHPDEPVPDGESFNDFVARAFDGLNFAMQKFGDKTGAVVTHYRNGRLYNAWDEAGQPADHSIDKDEFAKKGGPPGDLMEMRVNVKRLAGNKRQGDVVGKAIRIPLDVVKAAIEGDAEALVLLGAVEKQSIDAHLQLQPLDDEWARSPFPWDPNVKALLRPDQVKPFLGSLTDPDTMPVKTVLLRTCIAMQDRVDPDKVQWMLDNGSDQLPIVLRLGDPSNCRNVIVDGHHKMAAKFLQGRKTAQVRFADLTTPAKANAEAKEEENDGHSDK